MKTVQTIPFIVFTVFNRPSVLMIEAVQLAEFVLVALPWVYFLIRAVALWRRKR